MIATAVTQLVYGFRDKRPDLKKIAHAIYPEGEGRKSEAFEEMLVESRATVRGRKAAEARGENGRR